MIRIDAVSSYKYPNYSKKNLKTDSLNQQILVNFKNNEENLSFKSSFLKNANKKNMLSAYRTAFVTMLGFVGIKVAKNTKAKEKDPVSSKQILLNHLKAQTYISSQDHKTQKPLYSDVALEVIDEYYDEENQSYSQNLIKSLQYSASGVHKEDFEYIAKSLKYNPARVSFYKNLNKYPYEYVKYLKAADIDEILTQKIATADTNFVYYTNYSPQDTLDLVNASSEFGAKTIEKYINEKRDFIDKDNIINLASKDKMFNKEIEEIISFVDNEDIANKLHVNFVSEILPSYVQSPDSIKDLLKLQIYDARKVKASINGYNQAPEAFKFLLRKEKEQKLINEIDFTELSNYSIKLEKYKKELQKIIGENKKEVSFEDLKELLNDIENDKR